MFVVYHYTDFNVISSSCLLFVTLELRARWTTFSTAILRKQTIVTAKVAYTSQVLFSSENLGIFWQIDTISFPEMECFSLCRAVKR
jgi:hypothetical protein